VIVRRVRKGRSPLRFDRSHLHHRLLAGGLTQWQVVLIFYVVTATFGGVTILAAALQTRVSTWHLRIHVLPWLDVTASEVPTLAGLALVLVVTVVIWRVAAVLRRRSGLPPGASSGTLPRPSGPLLTRTASGSQHRR
jgi:UDP-N-acetylmuramyl pentapeptide phosphotransferase/UDP-N-acetylglucosamine-1-phosphate transferase